MPGSVDAISNPWSQDLLELTASDLDDGRGYFSINADVSVQLASAQMQ